MRKRGGDLNLASKALGADTGRELLMQDFDRDPTGMPRDVQSTAVIGPGFVLEGIGPTMQFFHTTPSAGRWTLSLLVGGPIDGAHLNEPFTATIDFKRPTIVARGLPNSPTTVLTAALKRSTIGCGVPAGTMTPNQPVCS